MSNIYWWLLYVCAGFVAAQLAYTFTGGKIYKERILNACNYICDYIEYNTKEGSAPCSTEVIYKNKLFNVGILFERTNSRYCIYRIFINGEEAAKYHILHHYLGSRSCSLEPENGRDRDEVVSIIFATVKMLKKQENPKPIPEHKSKSYFN